MKKKGESVKVDYERIKAWGITLPIFHTFIEINHNGKRRMLGFKTKRKSKKFWFFSILLPLKGMIKHETFNPDQSLVITKDKRKIKKLLKEIDKFHWDYYHMLFHNCFEWRDTVLKAAGIKPPKDKYWKPAKSKKKLK